MSELANGERLFSWPLDKHILTHGWYYTGGGDHGAIDLRTRWDDAEPVRPVYAAEHGVVDEVQQWDGRTLTGMQSYGNAVRIRHADYRGRKLQTRYAHLSRVCVAHGQQVAEGQLIGYTGWSGHVLPAGKGGAHLHFEVRLAGSRTNPLVWLDSDFSTASAAVYTYRKGEHAVARPVVSRVDTPAPGAVGPAQQPTASPETGAPGKAPAVPQETAAPGAVCLQRPSIVPSGEDAARQIAAQMHALRLPLQTLCTDGDAMTLMRLAQATGSTYTSVYE